VQRVVELVQVEYPVLEQVAESGCAHQRGAVPELDVLGEEQDTDARIFLVDRHGGSRSVGLMVGRHPDVHDCEQWAGRGNGRQQSGSALHCRGHLVSEVSQQSHQAFSKEHRVLGDDDPHQSTARIVVPVPLALVTSRSPFSVRLRRVTGSGRTWVIEGVNDYGGDVWNVVLILELDKQGLIFRDTRYYGQRSAPQAGALDGWSRWSERTSAGTCQLRARVSPPAAAGARP
jgi:hypothetical protein